MQNSTDNIDSLINNLNERKKELDCIYKTEEILKDFDNDLHIVLQPLVDIIPIAWRFSEICKIKISIDDIEVVTEGFKMTELKLQDKLFVDEKQVGEILLCYVKPVRAEKGIFLDEENRLFKTVVEKINQYLSYRKLKELYSENIEKKKKVNNNEEKFLKYLKSLNLTDKEIARITKVQIDFKKGETICKQGSFATFIMILKEGLLKAVIETSHYKNHIFKITTSNNIIGLSSLYGDNYYHFSCQALASSKVCLVERSTFDEIVKSNPAFSIEIMKMYSNSLQNVYDKLGSIANKQAIGKVCDTLLYLSQKVFNSESIETSITRKDIAEFSGLATENLVRILSELKRDNIITIKNKTIEIIDFNKLRMLADLG